MTFIIEVVENMMQDTFSGPEWLWEREASGFWLSDGADVCWLANEDLVRLGSCKNVLAWFLEHFGYDIAWLL